MEKLVISAPAKLNLFLQVTGKRDDGYHLIESIMQTVDLCDKIFIETSCEQGISLTCSDKGIPNDERNIAMKVARKIVELGKVQCGIKIHIEKNIPSGAGMGGGSSDGAAVLVGLNKILNLGFSYSELVDIGTEVGADIPFLIRGGTSIVTGIGEAIQDISPIGDCYFVIVKPEISIETRKAYEAIDRFNVPNKDIGEISLHIRNNDIYSIAKCLYNEFEIVAPMEVEEIKSLLIKTGAVNSLMTGSGSAVFGIYSDCDKANLAARELLENYDSVFIAKPLGGNRV